MIWPRWNRMALRSSGIPGVRYEEIPGAGHLLFHDHLDLAIPLLKEIFDTHLP